MRHSDNTGFFVGAVVGGMVGAMTTMLFTTKHGKRVQDGAVEKYRDLEVLAKKIVMPKVKKTVVRHKHRRRHRTDRNQKQS